MIAGLLFWAVSLPSLHSHLVFRLAVFAVVAWGFGRAIKEEPGWYVTLFYFLFALAFNPFGARFEKETWAVIDITSGTLVLLSIVLLDSVPFDTVLKTPNGKRVRTLTSIGFGIAGVLLGAFVIYNSARSITGIVRLKINGRETQARITRVTHEYYHTTDANNDPRRYDVYVTEYTFQTEDERLIASSTELSGNPVSNLSADDFRAKYPNGYEVDKNNPIALQVEYEKGNPTHNRALNDAKGAGNTILMGVSFALIFGLVPVILGFKLSKEHLHKLIERV